jgi:tetratricopeptide (TPR) repeat protein
VAAIAAFKEAIKLNAEFTAAYFSLGCALNDKGDGLAALAAFKKTLDLDPNHAQAHHRLGMALHDNKDLAGAITAYRRSISLDPNFAPAHYNLGITLKASRDLAGAIAAYEQAIKVNPTYARAYNNLAYARRANKDGAGAIAAFRKAIEADPKNGRFHGNLANALFAKGDLGEAIDYYQKAIGLDPNYALHYYNLGVALRHKKDLAGAIAAFEKAIQLEPTLGKAHYNLGTLLAEKQNWTVARANFEKTAPAWTMAMPAARNLRRVIAAFEKAIEFDPHHAEAHCNLGHAHFDQGNFTNALEAFKRGHELGLKTPGWPYPSAGWVRHCQAMVELDTRLAAVLKGEAQPKDAADQLALADLCQRRKKRYAAAARFYADAFAGKASIPASARTTVRYNAACAAALAAVGKDEGAAKLAEKEKTVLRQQALAWLHDALKMHSQELGDTDTRGRAALHKTLQHWWDNTDLDSVREARNLAQLRPAERIAWQQLWADVEELLQKAR